MTRSIGQTFRKAREGKEIALTQAAEQTHIKIQVLEAIEADNFKRIAAPLYARGFIKMYSEYLGIDPAPLLKEYNERYAVSRPPPSLHADSDVAAKAVEPEHRPQAPGYTRGSELDVTGRFALESEVVTPPAPRPLPAAAQAAPPSPAPVPAPVYTPPPSREIPRATSEEPARAPRTPLASSGAGVAVPTAGPASDASLRRAAAQARERKELSDKIDMPSSGLSAVLLRYAPVGLGALLVLVLLVSSLNRLLVHRAAKAKPATTVVTVNEPPPPAAGPLRLAQEPPAPYLEDKP